MLGEYHLTILEDKGLASRLAGELGGVAHNYQLTWPEFKRDPFGFVKRSVQGYGRAVGGFFARRDAVIAVLISLVGNGGLVGAIMLARSFAINRRFTHWFDHVRRDRVWRTDCDFCFLAQQN